MDPRRTVRAARLMVNLFDQLHQVLVLLFPARGGPACPVVVTRPRHVQHPAGHRDVDTVVGQFTDQRVDQFGRTFSRAKYAAARLSTSTSISSRRLSRRSWASSFFSALESRVSLPASSASAWASQLRRHDSLIRRSLASSAIGLARSRASSTARRRNSAG